MNDQNHYLYMEILRERRRLGRPGNFRPRQFRELTKHEWHRVLVRWLRLLKATKPAPSPDGGEARP